MGKSSHNSETAAMQRVIVACALVQKFNEVNKIVLAKRAETKLFLPGKYELPSGHVGFGEDIAAGLKRVVLEQLGVHIIVGDPYAAFGYINQAREAHSIKIVYFATLLDPAERITVSPEDYSEYEWFSQDQLHLIGRPQDDQELAAASRAFALLGGKTLNFGMAA